MEHNRPSDAKSRVDAMAEDPWAPIATAPKDGTWVLVAGGDCDGYTGENTGRAVVAQWINYFGGFTDTKCGRWQFAWYDCGYFGTYDAPTHWMPLPAPPQSA